VARGLSKAGEREVTSAAVDWLVSRGWVVVARALPRGGHGVALRPGRGHARGGRRCLLRGTWIPDVVAVRDKEVLLLESKPALSQRDLAKLERARAGAYDRAIAAAVRFAPARVVLAVALRAENFNGPLADRARAVCDLVLLVSRCSCQAVHERR